MDIFDDVVRRIDEGTITINDFNRLIEATGRSAEERVYRHKRIPRKEPTIQPNISDRTVPRRDGINDPPNQGCGKRYASGTPAKERQNAKQRIKRRKTELASGLLEAINIIKNNYTKDPNEVVNIGNVNNIRAVASALLKSASARSIIADDISSDWLYNVVLAADARLLKEGANYGDIGSIRLLVDASDNKKQKNGQKKQKNDTAASRNKATHKTPWDLKEYFRYRE